MTRRRSGRRSQGQARGLQGREHAHARGPHRAARERLPARSGGAASVAAWRGGSRASRCTTTSPARCSARTSRGRPPRTSRRRSSRLPAYGAAYVGLAECHLALGDRRTRAGRAPRQGESKSPADARLSSPRRASCGKLEKPREALRRLRARARPLASGCAAAGDSWERCTAMPETRHAPSRCCGRRCGSIRRPPPYWNSLGHGARGERGAGGRDGVQGSRGAGCLLARRWPGGPVRRKGVYREVLRVQPGSEAARGRLRRWGGRGERARAGERRRARKPGETACVRGRIGSSPSISAAFTPGARHGASDEWSLWALEA